MGGMQPGATRRCTGRLPVFNGLVCEMEGPTISSGGNLFLWVPCLTARFMYNVHGMF